MLRFCLVCGGASTRRLQHGAKEEWVKRIYLIRHGQTAWNAEGRWQGVLDVPLSDTGRQQADDLAAYLSRRPLKAIYCSDLSRAVETAAPISRLTGLTPRYDQRLREMNMGVFQGLTHEEHREQFPELVDIMYHDYWGFVFPQGESRGQVRDRALALWREVMALEQDGHFAFIMHGGPIRLLLLGLFGERDEFEHVRILNTSITTIDATAESQHLIGLVETPHLRREAPQSNAL